jgi:hypothetical protein
MLFSSAVDQPFSWTPLDAFMLDSFEESLPSVRKREALTGRIRDL